MLSRPAGCQSNNLNLTEQESETKRNQSAVERVNTHYWTLSANLGDQALFLDLVANFLFLSLR